MLVVDSHLSCGVNGKHRSTRIKLWFLIIVIFFPGLSFSQGESRKKSSLDGLVSQWIELESQKGNLQVDWTQRRQELDRKLELFDAERDALLALVNKADNVKSDVDSRRLELLEKQTDLESEQAEVNEALARALSSLETLLHRLPPPLQQEWRDKKSLLERDGASNSEKLERVLVMTKLVEDFDGRVAVHRTAMNLSGAEGNLRDIRVTQVFLGAGQAWYVSEDGAYYGYGRSTTTGWQWWGGAGAEQELGRALDPDELLRLCEILENPTTARYLSLPIKI